MKKEKYGSDIPWWNTSKWKKGEWYPMPYGFMARDFPGWILEGWGIYKLEERPDAGPGDIEPVLAEPLAFSVALQICEAFNKRRMIG